MIATRKCHALVTGRSAAEGETSCMRASAGFASWTLAAALAVTASACSSGIESRGVHVVRYADRDHGWAVGRMGLVLETRDGGKSWVRRESGVAAELRALAVATTRDGRYVGVAAGERGALVRTRDGRRWTRVDAALGDTLRSAAASEHGALLLVGGDAGTLLRSTDYGVSWTSVAVGSANVTEVGFDAQDGTAFAHDDAGARWGSRDGALRFELVSGPEEPLARNESWEQEPW
jgi:photosystem II stability/assembly factor-like uncharacterized protein